MATFKEAQDDAKFYSQFMVKVTYYDKRVEYFSCANRKSTLFIPEGYVGTVETLFDYRKFKAENHFHKCA